MVNEIQAKEVRSNRRDKTNLTRVDRRAEGSVASVSESVSDSETASLIGEG